jgi:hypothetical protein
MRRRYDVRWRLTGVATRRAGWVADPDGLNPIALLNGHWPTLRGSSPSLQNAVEWLEQSRADVFFETSSLDPLSGQPAIDHLKAALNHGAHAIFREQRSGRARVRRVDRPGSRTRQEVSLRINGNGWRSNIFHVSDGTAGSRVARIFRRAEFDDQRGAD